MATTLIPQKVDSMNGAQALFKAVPRQNDDRL
jgi:hypothetical protein